MPKLSAVNAVRARGEKPGTLQRRGAHHPAERPDRSAQATDPAISLATLG